MSSEGAGEDKRDGIRWEVLGWSCFSLKKREKRESSGKGKEKVW